MIPCHRLRNHRHFHLSFCSLVLWINGCHQAENWNFGELRPWTSHRFTPFGSIISSSVCRSATLTSPEAHNQSQYNKLNLNNSFGWARLGFCFSLSFSFWDILDGGRWIVEGRRRMLRNLRGNKAESHFLVCLQLKRKPYKCGNDKNACEHVSKAYAINCNGRRSWEGPSNGTSTPTWTMHPDNKIIIKIVQTRRVDDTDNDEVPFRSDRLGTEFNKWMWPNGGHWVPSELFRQSKHKHTRRKVGCDGGNATTVNLMKLFYTQLSCQLKKKTKRGPRSTRTRQTNCFRRRKISGNLHCLEASTTHIRLEVNLF